MVPSSDGSARFVFMILENLTHGFDKPHVLDMKMGFRQHSDEESQEKIARKTERVMNSTSATLGARLLGLQTYDRERHRFVLKDKYYGRALSVEGLQSCIAEFGAGFNGIAARVASQLAELSQAVRATTWRFWGSSVLIVFDADTLESALRTVNVKLIDFGTCQMEVTPSQDDHLPFEVDPNVAYDQGLVRGLGNLERMFRIAAGEQLPPPTPVPTGAHEAQKVQEPLPRLSAADAS